MFTLLLMRYDNCRRYFNTSEEFCITYFYFKIRFNLLWKSYNMRIITRNLTEPRVLTLVWSLTPKGIVKGRLIPTSKCLTIYFIFKKTNFHVDKSDEGHSSPYQGVRSFGTSKSLTLFFLTFLLGNVVKSEVHEEYSVKISVRCMPSLSVGIKYLQRFWSTITYNCPSLTQCFNFNNFAANMESKKLQLMNME